MAQVTYHNTEDSAATIAGIKRTVLVIDSGDIVDILERPATRNGMAVSDGWSMVETFNSYSRAIEFAERYAHGR
jgi:hypothetical protein